MGSNSISCGSINCSGTLTCGTLSCSSFSLGALSSPTVTGSITVNQTSATLPTAATQIGFVYTYKPTSYTGLSFAITTSLTPIPALTYTFPAIGVWLCVFEFTGLTLNGSAGLTYGMSLNNTSMDTGWNLSQITYRCDTDCFSTTRILSVSNLTTTLYCLAQVGSSYFTPTITKYTVQCTRIA